MNERLVEHLDQIMSYVKSAEEFVSDQAPLVVQEILTYYMWYHIIGIVITIAAFLVFWHEYKKLINHIKETVEYDKEFILVAANIFSAAIFCTISGIFITNVFYLIKVLIAPRVYILETVGGLI